MIDEKIVTLAIGFGFLFRKEKKRVVLIPGVRFFVYRKAEHFCCIYCLVEDYAHLYVLLLSVFNLIFFKSKVLFSYCKPSVNYTCVLSPQNVKIEC